jgi:hypothetical protein
MPPLRAFGKTISVLGLALGIAVAVCLLPENPYQRWQLLDGTIHARARWIYERSNFDPTPIDIAFIGPSRIEAGIGAPQMSEDLAARGLTPNVVNFSLPEGGRNLNYSIAELLFAHKHPKLLVIGVIEKPSRFGHNAFKYVADRELIADPGYFGDLNYFTDLIYLPYRQMRLFAADILPGGNGLDKQFKIAQYLGAIAGTTGSRILPDGTKKEGDRPASMAELERGVRKLERGQHPPILPPSLADVEFGDDRHYVREIAALAKQHGTKVAFLFLPYYTGSSTVQEERFYEQFGPVWNAGYLSDHAEWYADYGHMNSAGARQLTRWVEDEMTRTYGQDALKR